MSLLAEFKECQKICFDNPKNSELFNTASDRMDVLWIQLSSDEIIESRQYEIQLWIDNASLTAKE